MKTIKQSLIAIKLLVVCILAITVKPDMDASTIENYFAPLKVWLDEQNASRQCGW